MTDTQVWQTIALDLKRAANYLHFGKNYRAEYYLGEAKKLYEKQPAEEKMERIKEYIKFDGCPEDILLGSSLILGRIT